MNDALVLVGVCVCALIVLALPVIPRLVILVGIVVARSMTDVGAASTGSALPSTALSGALAAVAILVALAPVGAAYRRTIVGGSMCLAAYVLVWTLISVERFSLTQPVVQSGVRYLSLLAIFSAAGTIVNARAARIDVSVAAATVPAAAVLIAGYFTDVPEMVQAGGRAAGTFAHANAAGAFLAISALVNIGLFLEHRRRISLVAAAVSLVALVLSLSLGAAAGFAAGVTVLILTRPRASGAQRLAYVGGVTGGIVTVLLFTGLGGRLSGGWLEGGNAVGAASRNPDSLEWRFQNWSLLLDRWREHPWFGFGLGTTDSYVMPLGGPAHSMPIQLLVETGIIGAIFAVVFLGSVVRLCRKRRNRNHWECGVVLSIVTYAIVAGSESNLLGYTAAGYLIAFSGGLMYASANGSNVMMAQAKPKGSNILERSTMPPTLARGTR